MKEIVMKNDKIASTVYIDNNLDKFGIAMQQHKLQNVTRMFIIADKTVLNLYKNKMKSIFTEYICSVYEFETEKSRKDNRTINSIYEFLKNGGANKDSVILAVGGKSVIDLATFCSATYKNGMDIIILPTTLSSQVDDCLCERYYHDFNGEKDCISTVCTPVFIYIAINFLHTHTKESFNSGIVKIINYGLLKDKSLIIFLEENYKHIIEGENDKLLHIIRESLKIKAILLEEKNTYSFCGNFQKVSELMEFDKISLINSCVFGILISLKLSEIKFNTKFMTYRRINDLFNKFGVNTKLKFQEYPSILRHDKNIKFTLIDNDGICKDNIMIGGKEIVKAIKESISKEC